MKSIFKLHEHLKRNHDVEGAILLVEVAFDVVTERNRHLDKIIDLLKQLKERNEP